MKYNSLIELFKSFISHVYNNFSVIFYIVCFLHWLKIIAMGLLNFDVSESFSNYFMLVVIMYSPSLYFGDKISQWKSKVSELDWGFHTDYILSRSSPLSLLCLVVLTIFSFYILIPYIYSPIFRFMNLPSVVYAMVPDDNNPGSQGGPMSIASVLNPSTVPDGILPFRNSGFYYKTPGGAAKPYFWGQYHRNPMTLYWQTNTRGVPALSWAGVAQPCRVPNVLGGYYVKTSSGTYTEYDPTRACHSGKELRTGILTDGRDRYIGTGIYTPSACPIAIPDDYS